MTMLKVIGIQSDVKNVRALISRDYIVFYQIADDTIKIISIWDCRQKPQDLTIPK
jgi:hypothetical protein